MNDYASQPDFIFKDKSILIGFLAIFIGLGGFLAWAWFVPLSEGVSTNGQVVVEQNKKSVQHLEGGIIKTIHVKNGDIVKKNDILMEIDATQSQANVDLLRLRYASNMALLAKLRSILSLQSTIDFDETLLQDAQKDKRIQNLLNIQKEALLARLEQYHGEVAIYEQRIKQLHKQIEGIISQQQQTKERIDILHEELHNLEQLRLKRLVELPVILATKKELTDAKSQIGKFSSDIASHQVSINETEEQILQLKRNMITEANQQITDTQNILFDLQEQMRASEDILTRTAIIANQDGAIHGFDAISVGSVITSGQTLMEIVPQGERLVVKAKIQANDIDNIRTNQKARILFSSFRARTTPTIYGFVEIISPDLITDKVTAQEYYEIILGVTEHELQKLQGLEIVPGMPAEVLIEGGERTAIEYFIEPISQVLRQSFIEQ